MMLIDALYPYETHCHAPELGATRLSISNLKKFYPAFPGEAPNLRALPPIQI
jgi:hypothetical protein